MTKISGDSFGADFGRMKDALTNPAGGAESTPAVSGVPASISANAPDELSTHLDSAAAERILGLNPASAANPGVVKDAPGLPVSSEFHRQLTDGRLRAQLAESSLAAESGKPQPGDESSLNPQPLPPRNLFSRAAIGSLDLSPGGDVALNPQPLPPKELMSRLASIVQNLRLGGEAMLNPQPLPLRESISASIRQFGDEVSLNPQPLPPREAFLEIARRFGDEVSLNPQPLPPKAAILEFARRLGDEVALNPQPLPPRQVVLDIAHRLGDEVSLNPQPLPPREAVLEFARRLGNAVSLNPQPLPPRDPGDPPLAEVVFTHATSILESGLLMKGQNQDFDRIVRQVLDQPSPEAQSPDSQTSLEAWTRFEAAARKAGF
jgi:hypothetical protein